jgi:putative peptidoglycan lipid II flippase
VFGRTVGANCVGAVYQTVNTVPNIVFDIVAGGLLSALVIPILAPALHSGDLRTASRLVSAMLCWVLVVLVAATALVVVFAGPITRALLGSSPCAGAGALGIRMLDVFAPQLIFYGIGVVLGGALQAGERFAWPALAPLLSSTVVVAAYLAYGALSSPTVAVARLSRTDELILSVGTTVGVVVLAMCLVPAAWRLGLRPRLTLRFPAGVASSVRRAAWAGSLTLAAQQAATVVMLRLANSGAERGTVVVVTLAQSVYLLPWAVLSVPVATSLFPRLSAAWNAADRAVATQLAQTGVQAVSALAAIGTALLVACAGPVAELLLDRRSPAWHAFGPTIAIFGGGLLGWSVVALLARVLYATRRVGLAATAQVVGWLVTIGLDVLLAGRMEERHRAVALALGNGVGVSVAAGLLLVACHRAEVLSNARRTGLDLARAVLAAVAGGAAGRAVAPLVPGDGSSAALARAALSALVAVAVAVAVLGSLDRSLLGVLRQLRRPAPSATANSRTSVNSSTGMTGGTSMDGGIG